MAEMPEEFRYLSNTGRDGRMTDAKGNLRNGR